MRDFKNLTVLLCSWNIEFENILYELQQVAFQNLVSKTLSIDQFIKKCFFFGIWLCIYFFVFVCVIYGVCLFVLVFLCLCFKLY